MTIGPKRGKGRPPRVAQVFRAVRRAQAKRPQANKRMRWRKGP